MNGPEYVSKAGLEAEDPYRCDRPTYDDHKARSHEDSWFCLRWAIIVLGAISAILGILQAAGILRAGRP